MTRFTIIILICSFISCTKNSQKNCLGEETSKGKYITYQKTQDSLKLSWDEILKNEGLHTTVSEIKIIKNKDLKTQKEFFGILATTKNDSAKIMCVVKQKEDKFYFPKSKIFNMVVCFGSKKCNPAMYGGSWACDDGSNSQSCSLNCQKKSISTINE